MMIHDLSRTICAAQTHRRMIDPITFAKRVVPFEIVRTDFPAASVPTANDPSAHAEASMGQGVSK
jgi:hypothetical protein